MAAPTVPVPTVPPPPPPAESRNPIRDMITQFRAGQQPTVEAAPLSDAAPTLESADPAYAALEAAPAEPIPQPLAAPLAPKPAVPEVKPDEPAALPDELEPKIEAPPTTMMVRGPGRNPGEEVEIEVADPETAARLRQWADGYARGNEVRQAQIETSRMREDLEAERDLLTIDPLSYIVPNQTPESTGTLALQLLALPGVFDAVVEDLRQWEDPATRDKRRAELELDYLRNQTAVKTQIEGQKVAKRAANACQRVISALIPPNLTEGQRRQFVRDASRDVVQAMDPKLGYVDPRQVPKLLEERLVAYGRTPADISRVMLALRNQDADVAPVAPTKLPPPRLTGQQILDARRNRDAAVLPGTGAAAPSSTSVNYNPADTVQARIQQLKASRSRAAPS